MRRLVSVLVGSALLLSGCGSVDSTQPRGNASSDASTPFRVSNLVGLWKVKADGEPATVLRFDFAEVSVWRPCGALFGSWRALADGVFVASADSGSSDCFDNPTTAPESLGWLTHASRAAAVPDGFDLLSAHGDVTAHLTPGTKPSVPPNILGSLADPPRLTDDQRAKLDTAPAELPAGRTPATTAQLEATWLPSGSAHAFVTFKPDGSYAGSDGCNGSGGRWAVGVGGSLLATSGPSTLVGCENIDVAGWVASSARAAVDGDDLILFDTDGHETHRLHRGPVPASSGTLPEPSASPTAIASAASAAGTPSAAAAEADRALALCQTKLPQVNVAQWTKVGDAETWGPRPVGSKRYGKLAKYDVDAAMAICLVPVDATSAKVYGVVDGSLDAPVDLWTQGGVGSGADMTAHFYFPV